MRKPKFKRESSAWQYLANKLEAQGRMSRYTMGFAASGELCSGLCAEVRQLENDKVITYSVYRRMRERIDDLTRQRNALPSSQSQPWLNGYLWPALKVAPRIVAAQLLALLAKQEERDASRRPVFSIAA
jgi:hypothetical protein